MAFPRVPVTSSIPQAQTIVSLCCPLNDRSRLARNFFKIGSLSYFFCLSLARLRLLLLLINRNVDPNTGSVFSCLVCAGNVTWRGRSMQCCTCFKWVHLKCLPLSFSKFRTLGSSRTWSFPPYCVPASSGNNTVTSFWDSYSLYISTVQSGPPLLMQHSCSTPVFKPFVPLLLTSYRLLLHSRYHFLFLAVSLHLQLPLFSLTPSAFFNEILGVSEPGALNFYTFLAHPVDLICIQESSLNLSSSFRTPGFSALRSGRITLGLAFSLSTP